MHVHAADRVLAATRQRAAADGTGGWTTSSADTDAPNWSTGLTSVVLAGRPRCAGDDDVTEAGPGDVVIVPPDTDFSPTNTGTKPLRVLACMPVAGQARIDGETQTLPWMR